jgi:hypothetical protein
MSQQPQKQLTAAQKIEQLENAVVSLNQTILNLTRQNQMLQEGLSLLNDKVSSMVAAMDAGLKVNDDTINHISQQRKVEDMKKKVENLLDQGVVKKSEEVTKNSFVVIREIDTSNGKVINPRLQFVTRLLNQDSLAKMLGKKAGESVKFTDDGSVVVEIEEVYEIQENKQESQASESESSEAQA